MIFQPNIVQADDSQKLKIPRYIFLTVLVVKIIIMGAFSSDYQNRLFIPFVNTFLELHNPYEVFYNNDLPASFPYFPFMLIIESAGGLILKVSKIKSVFLTNLIFKMPLLICDVLCYTYIRKIGVKFKYAMVFYFCAPILIYATYIHSQLDIIPTAFLIIALYHLLDWKKRNHLLQYSIFLGLALATKMHILAVVPIFFVYIVKKRGICKAVVLHLISFTIVSVSALPFWSDGFIKTVLFNREQGVLFTVTLDYGSTQVLIPILVLVFVYFGVLGLNFINKNLLISLLALLFAVFLICIPPMPGWFVWIAPFIALYFGVVDKDKHNVMAMYGIFSLLYVCYFLFLHSTDYVDVYYFKTSLQSLKIVDRQAGNTIFTIMSSVLCIIIYKIYRFGITQNNLYQRRGEAFTIGITGDSGAGKTKMLEKIERLFGTGKDILFIEGDGDHRWERGNENWEQYTALDPQANYLYKQAEDIIRLKRGTYVERVEYDHDIGRFTERKRISPKKYVVLCGLHSLYLPKLRNALDLKIYMDTEEELRKYWKIQRDTQHRGYSREKIVEQIEKRYGDAEKYIYPQKDYADLIITYFDKELENCYAENHEVILSVKFNLTIDVDVEPIVDDLKKYGVDAAWKITDDFLHQEIVIDGRELMGKQIDFSKIAEDNITQYEDFFTYVPQWGSDIEGVIQLILLFMISNKMQNIYRLSCI